MFYASWGPLFLGTPSNPDNKKAPDTQPTIIQLKRPVRGTDSPVRGTGGPVRGTDPPRKGERMALNCRKRLLGGWQRVGAQKGGFENALFNLKNP